LLKAKEFGVDNNGEAIKTHLGYYQEEDDAAEAYDIAVLKVIRIRQGAGEPHNRLATNFERSGYGPLLPLLDAVGLEELVQLLRAQPLLIKRGAAASPGAGVAAALAPRQAGGQGARSTPGVGLAPQPPPVSSKAAAGQVAYQGSAAPASGQAVNQRVAVARKGPSSVYTGVYREGSSWRVQITLKELGKQVYLGIYEKEEDAAEAYDIVAHKVIRVRKASGGDASKIIPNHDASR